MGEAGLEPTEVGKEIAERARHSSGHSDTTWRERVISIIEAVLLAVVALLAAFSGYAAAKWSTESRLTIAEASTARNSSNTADLAALDFRIGDALTFNAWLSAHALNDPAAMEVAVRRFRPEFRVAFDAWVATNPDTNPDAPPGPQSMPQYQQPEARKAQELKAKGERLFEEGSKQSESADDYVKTTVYLAAVLFLVGISTHFPVRSARYGLLVVGGVLLGFSIVQLVTLPKPPW
jgi:hypothetical protein